MIERCRLCGGDQLRPWMLEGRNRDLVYYRCADCKLWNYDLDCGVDQTQYTANYVSPADPEDRDNRNNLRSWRFFRRYLQAPGTMLDIGCGNGAFLYFARQEGWQVRGLELSDSAARAIREDQGIDVDVASFLDYDGDADSRFDVVVLRHVLEHLPDSRLAMLKIAALLKDDGVALLEFPNTGSVGYGWKRLLKNRGLRNRKYAADWRPGHVNEFCREAFEYLLQKSGFDLVEWRTYSNKPFANAVYRFFPVASKVRAVVRRRATRADDSAEAA